MPDQQTKPYEIYQDTEQWIPWFNWFWIRDPVHPGEEGQGGYPCRWMAERAARRATRNA